ncbi:hypothetical protein ACPOL_1211 [Acidisarcina polymorpha]|uniref:PilZ domain-containing protein n=1 Tax=Acidisarcina polymorpha TaxID=2211140 RepID=A0A2Z5FUK7_9BACT|nr:hypothetical protein [Acidisarcina polymorpha]AXC10559.1 hypothetical protein ACPOL_1211 [Acidisarcina polymorpha]
MMGCTILTAISNFRRLESAHPPPYARYMILRKGSRYKLRFPVIYRWSDGEEHVDGGFTKYISRHAAWVLSERPPPMGSNIEIEVLVPSPDETGGYLRIKSVGKMVRQLNEKEGKGFLFQGPLEDEQITLVIQ